MGLVWCLNKSMDLSNTTQGGNIVLKKVFMGGKWKNSFRHFFLYIF